MLAALGNVLGNPHFEAYWGGPLAGVILACVFAGLGKRPPSGSNQSHQSPRDAQEKIHDRDQRRPQKNITVHHHHYSQQQANSGDDGPGLFVVAGIVLLVAMFLFAAFLPQISDTLYFFITAVAMFSMTASILAFLTGQFNTMEWWQHAIFPFAISIGCFWLTVQAYQAISPEVVAFAQSLLGDRPMNLGLVISGAFKFYQVLGDGYAQWILFDMLAFICISICAVAALFRCVFYVALSNTRSDRGTGWHRFALWTEPFSGTGTAIVMIVLIIAGWYLATGRMYQLIH
jgi:hypothetical protein